MKKLRISDYLYALVGAGVLILLDQFTKYLAVAHLKDSAPFVIWKGVFELNYLENRGMAFGMMQNQRIFFVVMTTVVMAALIYFYAITPGERRYLPLRICMVFLGAGAVGNLIDRTLHGYVVDFFYFSLIDFPIFNVADIYVTVTFGILLLLVLFYYKEEDFIVYSRAYRKGAKK
ncbi:signal peptidase II [Roseburia hominis]